MSQSSIARGASSYSRKMEKRLQREKMSEFLKANRIGKVSVIIPTYNEKDNVRPVVETLEPYLKPHCNEYEIIFVDDSSPDGTAEEVRRLAKEKRCIRLIVRNVADGLGGAQKAGLDAATGDILILLDGDCSQDPGTCVDFLYSLSFGNDLVVGSRFMKGGRIVGYPFKRLVGKVANTTAMLVLGHYLHDFTHSYRAMRKTAYDTIKSHLKSKNHPGFCLEISVFAHKAGLRVAEVPTIWRERSVGTSKLGLGSTAMCFLREIFMLRAK